MYGKDVKNPRWELDISKVRIVTLQIIESFKGTTESTFTLISGDGNCAVPFKRGKTYLVFTSKPQASILQGTQEDYIKRLMEEEKEFNKNLPLYRTTICDRTYLLESRKNEIQEIRKFVKNGTWIDGKENALQ